MIPSTNTASPPPSPKEPPNTDQPTRRRKPASPDVPPPEPLKCPRCDSTNTKFCYYNNYSLSQPRHFCKTCRRYWTQGGALRHVPIGGGCRRSKRPRSAAETLVPFHPLPDFRLPTLFPFAAPPNLTPASGTLRFSGGVGSPALLSFSSPYNFSGGDQISSIAGDNGGGSLPPPISSLNLELQWKLHGAGAGGKIEMNVNKNDEGGAVTTTHVAEKPQPIFFQNILEVTGATNPHHQSAIAAANGGESAPAAAGDWFFTGGEKGRNEEKENDADGGGNQGWGDQCHHINGFA